MPPSYKNPPRNKFAALDDRRGLVSCLPGKGVGGRRSRSFCTEYNRHTALQCLFLYLCICVFVCLYFVQNTTGVHALQTCNVFGGLTPSFNTVPVSALVVALHSECLPQNLNYS